jgi:hypothetical protein
MTKAKNLSTLAEGGYKTQALRDAKNQSFWVTTSADSQTTVFGFADGSALVWFCDKIREATPEEIAEYQ